MTGQAGSALDPLAPYSPSRLANQSRPATLAAVGLSLALFGVALAVRLPYLTVVPFYWDEGVEVLLSLDIAQGRRLPLTGVSPYQGPFFFYLMAGLHRLVGPHPETARLVAALSGALLVVVTYWLARSMLSRPAALAAAGVTLVSPSLVIEASHYGWANSLTPLLIALTLLAAYRGVVGRRAWPLALSGLLGALAVHTQAASAAALVGVALWFLLRRDLGAWLRRPAPYAAVGLFLVGMAPLLIANRRPAALLQTVVGERGYALAPVTSVSDYLARFWLTTETALRGVWDGWLPASAGVQLVQLALLALMALGLVWAARGESRLLVFVMAAGLFLTPLIVRSPFARYLAYLIPVLAVALGFAAQGLALGLRARGLTRLALLAWGIPVLIVALAAWQTLSTLQGLLASGDSNVDLFRVRDQILDGGLCGPGLVIERNRVDDWSAAAQTRPWFSLLAMEYELTLRGCRFTVAEPTQTARLLSEPGRVQSLLTWRVDGQGLPPRTRLEAVDRINPPPTGTGEMRVTLYRVSR